MADVDQMQSDEYAHPPYSLRRLARLLVALNPAVGWQSLRAGHGISPRIHNPVTRSHPFFLMTPSDTDAYVARGVDATALDDPEPTTEQFAWYKHWYPVNVVDTMDPTRPHEVQLLDLSLVAWNDGPTVDGKKQPGTWRVFADACPHRMGPLSEGRVESDGNLLCSYHAWRFDAMGNCAELPYSPERVVKKHCASCRSRCEVYPSRVEDGLLWVFPCSGPDSVSEAARVNLPLISELRDPAVKHRWKWKIPAGVRDFPCRWEMMLESILENSHTSLASRNVKMELDLDKEGGFALSAGSGKLQFRPPCLVKYSSGAPGRPVIATYVVPTRPGSVRPIASVLYQDDIHLGNTIPDAALSFFLADSTPDWVAHVGSSVLLPQGSGLLYGQYSNLHGSGNNRTSAGVLAFRQWLRTYGGDGVPWAYGDPLLLPEDGDFGDIWNAHTKHCQCCQVAERNLQIAKYASLALGAVALGPPNGAREPVLAITSLLLAGVLEQATKLFRRYEHSHADSN